MVHRGCPPGPAMEEVLVATASEVAEIACEVCAIFVSWHLDRWLEPINRRQWVTAARAPSGSTWHHRPYQPDQRHQDEGRTNSYKQQSNFSHGPPSRHQFSSKS
jgi:hypothetical protein